MSKDRRRPHILAGLTACIGLCAATPLRAEIVAFDAEIAAEVRETINGQPGSSDSAFEQFGETSGELPISVRAQLGLFDPLERLGLAVARFRDPTQVGDDPNPQELGLEVASLSLAPGSHLDAEASAIETRTIRLDRGDLLEPREQGVLVLSSIFLSGSMVVWSVEEGADLTGLRAEVGFQVFQVREREGGGDTGTNGVPRDATEVFSARLVLTGRTEGQVILEGEGDLIGVLGGEELLLLDESFVPTVGALDDVFEVTEQLGEFHVLLIPPQILPYLYGASPGDEFELEAHFRTRVVDLPEGAGAAAVFGQPFSELGGVLDLATGGDGGAAVQSAINAAQQSLETVPGSTGSTGAIASGPLCGGLGFEALMFAPLFVGLRWLPGRRG